LNQKKLIQFILSREQWIAVNQLTHDAGYSPHVDLLSVVATDKQFRRAVPSCCDIICDFLSFFFFDLASEPKIADFELEVGRNEQVLWFDVAMNDV
jgi:hypothetical protein